MIWRRISQMPWQRWQLVRVVFAMVVLALAVLWLKDGDWVLAATSALLTFTILADVRFQLRRDRSGHS